MLPQEMEGIFSTLLIAVRLYFNNTFHRMLLQALEGILDEQQDMADMYFGRRDDLIVSLFLGWPFLGWSMCDRHWHAAGIGRHFG